MNEIGKMDVINEITLPENNIGVTKVDDSKSKEEPSILDKAMSKVNCAMQKVPFVLPIGAGVGTYYLAKKMTKKNKKLKYLPLASAVVLTLGLEYYNLDVLWHRPCKD